MNAKNSNTKKFYDYAHWYNQIHEHIHDDIDFLYQYYTENTAHTALELACGSGRICCALADLFTHITALDSSHAMLTSARQYAHNARISHINFIHGFMQNFQLSLCYDTILCALNSFTHITNKQDIHTSLVCIENHLKAKGHFILIVFNPHKYTISPLQWPLEYVTTIEHDTIDVYEEHTYNPTTQIYTSSWYFIAPHETIKQTYTLRLFTNQELCTLLQQHNLTIVTTYGDYDKSELTHESPWQIIIAQKK